MMNMAFKTGFICSLLLLVNSSVFASTVQISGGGTNVIQAAINAAAAGDVIEITDSATYTETYEYFAIGKWNLTIRAQVGAQPEINFTSTADHAAVWNPNVGGFKVGDVNGGPITIRKKRGGAISYAMATMWYPANETLTIENCKFTSQGAGGPWDGAALFTGVDSARTVNVNINNCSFIDFRDSAEPIILGTPWNPTVYLNLTSCYFYQSTPSANLTAIVGSTGSNIEHIGLRGCWFENYQRAVEVNAGSLTTTQTVIVSPGEYGIYVNGSAEAKTVNLNRSGFYGLQTGNHFVMIHGSGTTTVNVDHCDFAGGQADAPAIAADNNTNANIVVANSQIGTTPMLWSFAVGGTFNGSYHHCNLYGAGISGAWTDGGNQVAPPITPDYADAPQNWIYTDSTLLTADNSGDPVGSMENSPLPVELSAFDLE